MKFETIVVGPLGVNSYILYDEEARDAVIIDPGADSENIVKLINQLEVNLKEIWLTHGHFDHVGAASFLAEKYKINIYMNDQDYFLYKNASEHAAMYSLEVPNPTVDPVFFNMQVPNRKVGSFSIDIMHTPGHSPGSVCFFCKEKNVIFSGDLIFKFSVGRTDTFSGGSFPAIEKSILENIYTKGEGCIIYPGHGPDTTVGREKKHNQFVKAR